jgi:glycerol-3-phosphate dehydrogenase
VGSGPRHSSPGEENLYPSEIIEKMKVAVIGGGISGLSVGQKLADRGFRGLLGERSVMKAS